MKLPVFIDVGDIPRSPEEIRRVLNSSAIRAVRSYVLGPFGTNIMQAAERWHQEMGIVQKAALVVCDTPEQAVSRARAEVEAGVLSVSWSCAVYVRENQLFFENPDTHQFWIRQAMPLDEMQLATRPEIEHRFMSLLGACRILSHPSPAPLVSRLGCRVIYVNSNADAARRCAKGEGEACITTETARKIYGLVKLHTFGSPEMVFFGGICQNGVALLRHSFHNLVARESKTDADATPAFAAA